MPFAFLAPVFLVGLAALAVPILIHLSNRPRKNVVEFPSLMFLEQVEYQDSSRRRLRHILLFVLRSLALILVAAAFARPFLDRPDATAVASDAGRELVVLLDRSASMAVDGRMDRAREAVAAVADGLRRGDRATLVAFDHGAAVVAGATDQAAVLRSAADTVRPGDGATRFGPALRLAESILSGSPLPRRELAVVTDFQRTGWDPEAAARMPAGTEVRTLAVGEPRPNTFVADVRLGRQRFSGRERVRVTATVAHRAVDEPGAPGSPDGTEPVDGGESRPEGSAGPVPVEVPVELAMDDRVVATRSMAVPVGGAATVEFDPITLPDRAVLGTVRAGADALPGDNTHHFVLNAGRSLRVLVVEPRAGSGSGSRAPYLVSALNVSVDHDVTSVAADRLGGVELPAFDVVVLNGADPRDAGRLADFVVAGGGLIAVLGERSRPGSWAGADVLPGTLRGTRDVEAGAALADLRSDHPVFQAFRSGTGGLTAARFYRYRELRPADGATVLARFDAGAPAIVARDVGRGRVVALTSPLDGAWNDLVLQPGFVPLTHRLVRHASGREPGPAWRRVGDLLDVGAFLADAGADAAGADVGRDADEGVDGNGETIAASSGRGAGDTPVLLTPSDEPVPVDGGTLFTLTERGFYEVRDPRSGEAVPVAVNGDPAESEPAVMDPAVLEAAVSGGERVVPASFGPEDRERRQSLWWYFLVGAFVLIVAETMLSNGLSRRPLPTLKGGEE